MGMKINLTKERYVQTLQKFVNFLDERFPRWKTGLGCSKMVPVVIQQRSLLTGLLKILENESSAWKQNMSGLHTVLIWALPISFSGVILNPGSTTRNQHRWKSLNCGFQRKWKPFSLQFAIVWWKTLPSVCGIALHAMVDTWSMFCDCLLSGWWLVFQNFEQASQERPLLYDYWHHLAAPPGEPFIKLIDELLESLNVAFLC